MNGRLIERQQHRQGQAGRLRQQHADAGDAAVDEVAREQESLEPHPGREDAEDDERRGEKPAQQSPHGQGWIVVNVPAKGSVGDVARALRLASLAQSIRRDMWRAVVDRPAWTRRRRAMSERAFQASRMVRKRGFEPPLDCSNQLLRLARLPFRHFRTWAEICRGQERSVYRKPPRPVESARTVLISSVRLVI